jgi:adenylate cyclase
MISNLPEVVLQYFYRLHIQQNLLAYVQISPDQSIRDFGGNTAHFGFDNLKKGQRALEKLPFLTGMFPFPADPLVLPMVSMPSGNPADLHLFVADDSFWLICFDVSEKYNAQQRQQQRGNELSLLMEKQEILLRQHLGRYFSKVLESEFHSPYVKRLNLTIVFADIRNFTFFSEKNSLTTTFRILNNYLQMMLHKIIANHGVVDKIIGDAVMGIFGLLPSEYSPEECAVKAALEMLEMTSGKIKALPLEFHPELDLGIGVASGEVAMGVLGGVERKNISIIGYPVNLAAKLEGLARRREILIDEKTFEGLGAWKSEFKAISQLISSGSDAVNIFSLMK